jgi:hypothetical protein
MTTYKQVFSGFAFTPELEADVRRAADEALVDWRGRSSERLPRIDALRSAPEFREGLAMAIRDVASDYRNYEHLIYCELVPGFRERHALWSDADPETRPPDVLMADELPQVERILLCAMALARALHRAFHPYHEQTYVPFGAFVATVRRSFASQGYATWTPGSPR